MGLVTLVLLSVGHVTDLHPNDFIRHLTIKEQMGPETQDGLCHFSSSVSVGLVQVLVPLPAEEVQPATEAADTGLLSSQRVCHVHL